MKGSGAGIIIRLLLSQSPLSLFWHPLPVAGRPGFREWHYRGDKTYLTRISLLSRVPLAFRQQDRFLALDRTPQQTVHHLSGVQLRV